MVPKSTIYKQKKSFALVFISLYLFPPTPTFPKTVPRFLKCSSKKYSGGTKRYSSSSFKWKKQQSYIGLSIQLRRQGGKWRKRPGRKLRDRGLQRGRGKGEW